MTEGSALGQTYKIQNYGALYGMIGEQLSFKGGVAEIEIEIEIGIEKKITPGHEKLDV